MVNLLFCFLLCIFLLFTAESVTGVAVLLFSFDCIFFPLYCYLSLFNKICPFSFCFCYLLIRNFFLFHYISQAISMCCVSLSFLLDQTRQMINIQIHFNILCNQVTCFPWFPKNLLAFSVMHSCASRTEKQNPITF